MASEVDICNLALSNVRGGSINSLDEPSLQAQQCKLKYPIVRDMLLSDFTWGFNKGIKSLAELSDVDLFNWAYAYQYPSDCLHVVKLIPNFEQFSQSDGALRSRRIEDLYGHDLDMQIKFEVFNESNGKVIAANEQQLRIVYRKKVTDPNLFDNLFLQAFSSMMSAELAVPIVGVEAGRPLRQDALTMYKHFIQSAAAKNANEQYTEPQESEFITVRD